MRKLFGSPLAWVLAAAAVVRVVGIGWGLPSTDGWDNDGVAPRDFLVGLLETFTPGHYYTYPPIHLVLLAVLTSPISLLGVINAASLSQEDVVAELLRPPYMTAMAYVARAVSLAMSLGVLYGVAKIAEALRGPRAGWLAAAVAAFDLSLTYYAHTSNLDVPYLFWATMALLELVRALVRQEPRRFKSFAALAVLSVATKDQAYALFVVSVPALLVAWFGFSSEARRHFKEHAGAILRAAVLAVGVLLVADGVVFNPTGFRERLRFLSGPASQDFAQYSGDWDGRGRVLRATLNHYLHVTPTLLAGLVGIGVVLWLLSKRREKPDTWVAGWVPLLAALSFTLAFNCVARRVEHRFVLPQGVLLTVYGGIALDALLRLERLWLRAVSAAAAVVGLGQAAFLALAVDAALLRDPRYAAERWMREHVRRDDRIETYGLNVYLPRFPPEARVTRVGPEPATGRNPMPGFQEVQDAFGNVLARGPRFVVLCEGWAWRYLEDPFGAGPAGIITPPTQMTTRTDQDAKAYFRGLLSGQGGYHHAFTAEYEPGVFPWIDIHGSTTRKVWIFEREVER